MMLGDVDVIVDSGVYPPSEDTYLLLDAIRLDDSDSFLEVGCGTGIISVAAARRVKQVVALDISLDAVRNTLKNLERNSMVHHCEVLQSDLLTAIISTAKFSVIAFNPPYLQRDEDKTQLDHALVGGKTGTELTERFLIEACKHLESKGSIYLVVSTLGNIDKIAGMMIDIGLTVKKLESKSLFFESIQILRGTK
ncbi:MAG: HemK2/MTQ2 family protein methyltransferase [Candidatus Thorarchaeota archaeon]